MIRFGLLIILFFYYFIVIVVAVTKNGRRFGGAVLFHWPFDEYLLLLLFNMNLSVV